MSISAYSATASDADRGQGVPPRYVALFFLICLVSIAVLIWGNPPILQEHRFILPILIGMIAFPALIVTILYCFSVLSFNGMASRFHAFGLPPGSIRAVLAMGFIVLLMVFGVYLITEIKTPHEKLLILSEEVRAGDFRPKGQSDAGTSETPAAHAQRIALAKSELAQATSEKIDQLRQIYGREFIVANEAEENENFAKLNVYKIGENDRIANLSQQILTMLATALTAIVGFYFGSRTANEPEQTHSLSQEKPENAKALESARETLAGAIADAGQVIMDTRAVLKKFAIIPGLAAYEDLLQSGGDLDVYLKRQHDAVGTQNAVLDDEKATLEQVTAAGLICKSIFAEVAEVATVLRDPTPANLNRIEITIAA